MKQFDSKSDGNILFCNAKMQCMKINIENKNLIQRNELKLEKIY